MKTLGSAICFLCLGQGILYSFKLFKNYRRVKAAQDRLRTQPLLTLTQFRKAISHNPSLANQDSVLIRTYCTNSEKVSSTYKIYSNQVLYNKVPLIWMLRPMSKKLCSNDPADRQGISWTAQDNSQFILPQVLTPQLIQHTITYESIFDSSDPPGPFHSLFKYIMAGFAAIFEFFLGFLTITDTFIDGPEWGALKLTASLATNIPIVVYCKIKEGQLIPEFIGLQREDILKLFKHQQTKSYWLAFVSLSLLVTLGLEPIKTLFRQLKRQFRLNNQPRMYYPKVEDDQSCIICYANCKNVLFKNCNHMIICHECMRASNPRICPLCRTNITGSAILMEERHWIVNFIDQM